MEFLPPAPGELEAMAFANQQEEDGAAPAKKKKKEKKAKDKEKKAKDKEKKAKEKDKGKEKEKDKTKRKAKAKRPRSEDGGDVQGERPAKRRAVAGEDEVGGGGPVPVADEQQERVWLIKEFTPEQNQRYEAWRRAGLNRNKVKKIMATMMSGSAITEQLATVMSGIAKVYAGEVVEEARRLQREWGQHLAPGQPPESDALLPLQPRHLQEAVRRLKRTGVVPRSRFFEGPPML